MPYELSLPKRLRNDGWKVKILDHEPEYEPPHVTIRRGKKHWRINLRTFDFMDRDPPPRNVKNAVLDEIKRNRSTLIAQWDNRNPNNPV